MSTRVSEITVSVRKEVEIMLHIHDEDRDRTFNYRLDRKQLSQLIDDLEDVEWELSCE